MTEGKACPLLEAFILVNTQPGALWKVVEEAKKIEGVKLARAVAGRFDVVIHAEANNLSWIIARLHSINGVVKTESLMTLEAIFE
ncbi:MAG TPA: Lrp/AsnC ligand binding domain-containing protein [Candidatus Bathyarchaeia archaeon]|nr:Lrp/AsnC ligand binding domain-containing protein [Candidatus Bathyarchaeia archaeon]